MDFNNLINTNILEELYERECEEFEDYVVEENKEKRKFNEEILIAEELREIIKSGFSESKVKDFEIKFEQYLETKFKEYEYWTKEYFKLGIINGIRLKNGILNVISNKNQDFLSYYCNGFTEYLETTKIDNIINSKEYKILRKRMTEIKEKYPRVMEFLEDKDIIENPTKEEQKAIFDILDITEEMAILEEKEIFKMGMREMLNIIK